MKATQIVTKYKIDYYEFLEFLRKEKLQFRETLLDVVVEDSNVEAYVAAFQAEAKEKERLIEEEKARQAEEDARKKKAMAQMLITSGFNFDGYTIKKYSGYISGDDAMTVSRGSSFTDGGVRDNLLASLTHIRRNALRELKEAAYDLGCNAVIGVDFDYITLDPQTANISGGTTYQPYVFCVTANGNAVIIEKDED